MQRTMLKSKIHRATVMLLPTPDGPDNSALSNCELHYEGSCAIDEDLLDAANLVENEQIAIWNVNNGARLATYAIRAERGSGIVSLNGSAARRAQLGDLVIIAAFAVVEESELNAGWKPYLVFVDGKNKIRSVRDHVRVQNA